MALPDFMTKTITVPQTAGQPVNPAKPLPRFMLEKEVQPQGPQRGPTISAAEDIANVAPSAARTGLEMVPAGPAETSALAPTLVRAVLSKLNDWGMVVGGDQTLKDFDAGLQGTLHPKAFGQDINMDPRQDFGLESVRKNISDPLFGTMERPQAQTYTGKVVQRGLESGPSMLLGPGTTLQKLGMVGGSSAAGPGAAMLAEKAGLGEGWQEAADIGGSLLGGVSPTIFNRLSNPRPIPPERAPHVNVMRAREVPLSAGQITGDERLMRKEMMAGGTEAHRQQPGEFTRAAADIQGGFPRNTRLLTRNEMRAELTRMGGEFDRLTANRPLQFDQPLQDRILNATVDYQRDNPLVAPVVEDIQNKLARNAADNGGFLTGEGYQSARSKINELIRDENTDPGVIGALSDIQEALDEAMAANMSGEDAAAFRRVRANYRNFLPIERARAAPGAGSSGGVINPKQLQAGIKASQGRREVAAGRQPLTELAEAGDVTMTKPQSSGTAENLRAQLSGLIPLATSALAGGGAMLGELPLGWSTALAGGAGLAAAGLPVVRDMARVSDIGQRILARQGPRIPTTREGLAAVLAAARAAQLRQQGDTEAGGRR